jgi:predicted RND superfamily exporter protein
MDFKTFFSKILDSRIIMTIIIIASLLLGILYFLNKSNNAEVDLAIANQNMSSLNDSLRVSKNKAGELVQSKQILVVQNARDLKKLNKDLYEILKKYDGKIHELTNAVGSIKHDTVKTTNNIIADLPDGSKILNWNYSKVYDSENSRYLSGSTKFKFDSINKRLIAEPTLITKDEIKFNLTQGLRTTKDGKVEIFASSRYPGFELLELNSVIIDPATNPSLTKYTKKPKIKTGVYGGYGITANLGNGTVTVGPQIGVGVMYSFW